MTRDMRDLLDVITEAADTEESLWPFGRKSPPPIEPMATDEPMDDSPYENNRVRYLGGQIMAARATINALTSIAGDLDRVVRRLENEEMGDVFDITKIAKWRDQMRALAESERYNWFEDDRRPDPVSESVLTESIDLSRYEQLLVNAPSPHPEREIEHWKRVLSDSGPVSDHAISAYAGLFDRDFNRGKPTHAIEKEIDRALKVSYQQMRREFDSARFWESLNPMRFAKRLAVLGAAVALVGVGVGIAGITASVLESNGYMLIAVAGAFFSLWFYEQSLDKLDMEQSRATSHSDFIRKMEEEQSRFFKSVAEKRLPRLEQMVKGGDQPPAPEAD